MLVNRRFGNGYMWYFIKPETEDEKRVLSDIYEGDMRPYLRLMGLPESLWDGEKPPSLLDELEARGMLPPRAEG